MTTDSTIKPITISYSSLLSQTTNDSLTLSNQINTAFSSHKDSLGLLLITDLPAHYNSLRIKTLLLANILASLPSSKLKELEDKDSNYSFGWSHGKEIMNGKPDISKGSFYVTPHSDKNIWPNEVGDLIGFKESFEELVKISVHVGELVAKACDGLGKEGEGKKEEQVVGSTIKSIEELITCSKNSKARLLHYFAPSNQLLELDPSSVNEASTPVSTTKVEDSWCGTHIDSSLLTALCPAIYLFHPNSSSTLAPIIIPSPSPTAGLYIKTRSGTTIRAVIPENCLAFQTGETLELVSEGRLSATPHFVGTGDHSTLSEEAKEVVRRKIEQDQSWSDVKTGSVTRETMAVFLQPNMEEVISSNGETFSQFWDRVMKRHY